MRYIKEILVFTFFFIILSLSTNRTFRGSDVHRYIITMPSEDAAVFVFENENAASPLSIKERTGRFLLAESNSVLSAETLNTEAARISALSIEEDEDVAAFETDRYFGKQWAVNGSEHGINVSYVSDYVNKESYPNEVIVAVIDTGVDVEHEDLAENIWINEGEIPGDGIDNDGNGFTDDVNGWDFYHDDATVCHYAMDDSGKKTKDTDFHIPQYRRNNSSADPVSGS